LEDLVDDFATFFLAGQETTSSLLTFATVELHKNPDILQRVLDEISEVLDERQSVTVEDLEKLNYLEQVQKLLGLLLTPDETMICSVLLTSLLSNQLPLSVIPLSVVSAGSVPSFKSGVYPCLFT